MTKNLRPFFYAALVLFVLLSACAPASIPVTGGSSAATATFLPTPKSPDTGVLFNEVPMGPPAMQAGSAYRYFDGSLLDAVPGSSPFLMGPAKAQQQVALSDFWIYSTEVSNQMYAWCESLGKCTPPNAKDDPGYKDSRYLNDPVAGVTWQQAADYCTFAHGTLPTEAQWEKAATWDASLNQKRLYPWGDADPSCDLLNYKLCYGKAGPVLQFGQGQSYYGVYNLEGNVAEWVSDWYKPSFVYSGEDPQGPAAGTQRSIRGAAFDSDASFAAPTQRFSSQPTSHRSNLGFRCVVKDPAYFAPFCQLPVTYGINPAGSSAGNPCPDPSIEQHAVCGKDYTRHNIITVHSSGSTIVQISGLEKCSPGTDVAGVRHDCGPNTTVKVSASCNSQPVGSAACPPNYHEDPNNPAQCVAPGAPGSCPAGFRYDTSMQCCSAASATGSIAPLCSVGQHMYNGACVDDGSSLLQPKSVTFQTGAEASCIPGTAVPDSGSSPIIVTVPPQPTNTDVSPSDTPAPPPTDVPPTVVPPTDVPPTDVSPTDTPSE